MSKIYSHVIVTDDIDTKARVLIKKEINQALKDQGVVLESIELGIRACGPDDLGMESGLAIGECKVLEGHKHWVTLADMPD